MSTLLPTLCRSSSVTAWYVLYTASRCSSMCCMKGYRYPITGAGKVSASISPKTQAEHVLGFVPSIEIRRTCEKYGPHP